MDDLELYKKLGTLTKNKKQGLVHTLLIQDAVPGIASFCTNTPDPYEKHMSIFEKLLYDIDDKVRMEAPEIFRVLGKRRPEFVRPYLNRLQRIIEKMMVMPFCHMHGPEHHVMVGSALLTAYKNAGGDIDLHSALIEMMNRGKRVPVVLQL